MTQLNAHEKELANATLLKSEAREFATQQKLCEQKTITKSLEKQNTELKALVEQLELNAIFDTGNNEQIKSLSESLDASRCANQCFHRLITDLTKGHRNERMIKRTLDRLVQNVGIPAEHMEDLMELIS